ncbi:hypothetical protein GLOIN_2v1886690 [Rhizophagus irregularis DAOM 181602=DAOM 197198]|uniref:Uncharacterized protein n=2 Tax=Rhizophagus irregularis TaxID=588596 RepID=A0A2P4NK85_RHIID|nr:hypothetical protein GLOIN_2v1886690 [Rhizophagus irregularis DAOM 181602=DAOM 197198]POG53546.1 hypothetical protein GLOIN_2v1886690 [Rhizophagus irregularis DAOM 181602=DAOM 197198]|eukprot:XP_025164153.1 hypothetical protein GLOIN_2v1886690 [Rhizophagus irregularis DAOM 181602=DAOM 197198]
MVARIHDTYYDAKATLLSEADIKEIRESRGRIPNATQKMASKFHIGPKRVYEIWDNKERLQQGVVPEGVVISSSSGQPVLDENSQTDKIEQTESNIHGQNTSPFAELEKNIRDAKVESSKSTDSALEKGGSKAKKTGGKKSKSKSTLVELTPSSIQTQPIQTSKKDINNVNLDASYEKMV